MVVVWRHRLLASHARQLSQRDAVCVLTHDHKVDVPALIAGLSTDVGYIGARTPDETAISICAEILATLTGRMAPSLRDTEGPLH